MIDHPSRYESQIDVVLRRLEEIDQRLRELEARFRSIQSPQLEPLPPEAQTGPVQRFPARRGFTPIEIASLTGRTSLVLGGGYLLRALTDFDVLPLLFGVVLGLVYAISWFVMADRAGGSGKTASATFHALAASALAFPLLFEAMTKLELLGAWNVALAMTAVAALGLTVSWRRGLQGVGWIVSVAAFATALALLRTTEAIAPFALHLVLLAAMTDWVAYARGWWRLRWPPAVIADGAVVWLVMQSVRSLEPVQPFAAIVVALALSVTALASFTIRLLALGHDVIPFEVVQSVAALVVGYGGAAYVVQASTFSGIPLGVTAMSLGVCAYGVAFEVVGTHLSRKNFIYFSSLAIALVIAGGTLTFRPPVATVLWVVLALAGVSLARPFAYTSLSAHGAVYLVAAAAASGLLLRAGYGLLGPATQPWREITPVALLALAATVAFSAISSVAIRTYWSSKIVTTMAAYRASAGVPRAIALGLLVVGFAGVAVVWIAPPVAGTPGHGGDWGVIATIRTTVLAIAAVTLGLLARGDRIREAGWLVYPLLVAIGLKIVLEDFRQSEPATLFVALVVYGSALIVGPRLASK